MSRSDPALPELHPRFAREPVDAALADTPVVVIQGARRVGKSTLASRVAESRPHTAYTLDDGITLSAAREDPVSFLQRGGEGLMVIDEAQRAPELILPLKAEVDRNPRPGRFLLTGSADLLQVKGVADSLAGRAEAVELLPLSQGELDHRARAEDFATWILTGAAGATLQPLPPERVLRGGYPEAVRRPPQRASAWWRNYLKRLADHDARDLHQGGYPDELAKLLRLIAAGGLSELVKSRLARDLGVAQSTVEGYLRLTRTMRLSVELDAWGRGTRGRVIRKPKTALTDSGLSAHLSGATPASIELLGAREHYGALVEQFVALELLKQSTWTETPYDVRHFRDADGLEVDILLELPDGRLIAIEVKSGQTVTATAWRGLVRFRERFHDRDITGIVLHAGAESAHLHGWLHILPITSLWQHP